MTTNGGEPSERGDIPAEAQGLSHVSERTRDDLEAVRQFEDGRTQDGVALADADWPEEH